VDGLVKTFHSNPLSGDIFLFISQDRQVRMMASQGLTCTSQVLYGQVDPYRYLLDTTQAILTQNHVLTP
jgi:hypothetical protein